MAEDADGEVAPLAFEHAVPEDIPTIDFWELLGERWPSGWVLQ